MTHSVQVILELDQLNLAELLRWLQTVLDNANDVTLVELKMPGKGHWAYTGRDALTHLISGLEVAECVIEANSR